MRTNFPTPFFHLAALPPPKKCCFYKKKRKKEKKAVTSPICAVDSPLYANHVCLGMGWKILKITVFIRPQKKKCSI